MGLTKMEKGKQVLPPPSSSSSSSSSSSVPLLLQLPPLPLPAGIKFCPTEAELIGYYLHKKATGKQILPGGYPYYQKNPILECDVYGNQEPLHIFKALGKSPDDHLYVFTPLKTNSSAGKRLHAHGTWKPQTTVICRDDDTGCAIGRKTSLHFMDNKAQTTPWVMDQYTLLAETSWALCHIRHYQRKRKTALIQFPRQGGRNSEIINRSYGTLSIRST